MGMNMLDINKHMWVCDINKHMWVCDINKHMWVCDINKHMWVCDIKAHCRCGLCVHNPLKMITCNYSPVSGMVFCLDAPFELEHH
jgi:hypothetical protein